MFECINLKDEFGGKYKVEYEESYYAQYGENARTVDPWYMQVCCLFGIIYPFGGTLLAASVNAHSPKIARRLKELSCCQIHQNGDFHELTVLFDLIDFETIAEVMKPRRRRRLSPERRQAAAERLRPYQFPAHQSELSGPERT